MEQNSPIVLYHPHERLPWLAPNVSGLEPKVDLQHGTFFITNEEFEVRVNGNCFYLWNIQGFGKLAVDNYKKIKERHLACGDLEMFVQFLSIFFKKRICRS